MKILINIVFGVIIAIAAGILGLVPFSGSWWLFFLFCFAINMAGYIEGKLD